MVIDPDRVKVWVDTFEGVVDLLDESRAWLPSTGNDGMCQPNLSLSIDLFLSI